VCLIAFLCCCFSLFNCCIVSLLYRLRWMKMNIKVYTQILAFFVPYSRPQSDGWPHHGRALSIYLYLLPFWLTLPQGVPSTSWYYLSRPITCTDCRPITSSWLSIKKSALLFCFRKKHETLWDRLVFPQQVFCINDSCQTIHPAVKTRFATTHSLTVSVLQWTSHAHSRFFLSSAAATLFIARGV